MCNFQQSLTELSLFCQELNWFVLFWQRLFLTIVMRDVIFKLLFQPVCKVVYIFGCLNKVTSWRCQPHGIGHWFYFLLVQFWCQPINLILRVSLSRFFGFCLEFSQRFSPSPGNGRRHCSSSKITYSITVGLIEVLPLFDVTLSVFLYLLIKFEVRPTCSIKFEVRPMFQQHF